MPLKDLPTDCQPREKLLAKGAGALTDAELLAILLRTGMAGKSVLQWAAELLAPRQPDTTGSFGGINGLLQASSAELAQVKGLGPAKRAELIAVLSWPAARWPSNCSSAACLAVPPPSKPMCSCTWRTSSMRCLPCCFLTASTS